MARGCPRPLAALSTAPVLIAALLLQPLPGGAQSPPPNQVVWFAPQDPAFRTWSGVSGSVDYMDLFAPGAPWSMAESHVQIFKMYWNVFLDGTLPNSLTDADIQQILAYLNAHNIALAVEWEPLTSQTCGLGIEGFGAGSLQLAQRIQQLGGNLQYLDMDEPFQHAGLYSGPNACQWTPQQVAASAVQSLAQIRTVFPNVIVGDTEVVPDEIDSPNWLASYAAWVDAWQQVAGVPLAFFLFDVNWTIEGWQADVEGLREALAARHIPFGMIYNGESTDLSDAAWVQDAESHYVEWEAEGGTPPNHVVFQSWNDYPLYVLPEADPTSFTYLIDSYFRQRTSLSLMASATTAAGTLSDSGGTPISSAPITLVAQPTSGPGIVSTYILSGTAPQNVSQGLIQICVNQCGEAGANQMNVYSFAYSDSGGQSTLSFANGLAGWGTEGNGTAVLQLSSDGNGPYLQISATPAQQTFVNSSTFPVVPGGSFNLNVKAMISPSSAGSGYFALIFLVNGTEVSRDILDFAPGTVSLGSAETANDGTFTLSFAPESPGDFLIQASYAGTGALWPAFANSPLDITPYVPSNGVVNGADFKVEPLSAGSWISVFGQDLGQAGQWASAQTYTLGGATVSVCGASAAIAYNSGPLGTNGSAGWQLNALIPDSVAGQTSCPVVVTVDGQSAPPVMIAMSNGIMELFSFNSSAGPLPIVTHLNYHLVGPTSAGLVPAQPGETLVGWGTGDCSTPNVSVGGEPSAALFSGQVGPGLCQLNFVVPTDISGSNTLSISSSLNTYSLWVGN
jgi:uncharacterized protein (TIGR03437 family)